MHRSRLAHQPGLDGVRGIAVAAVLVFHGGFAWMTGGFLGVSTFFTLSGFLIASLLLREWGDTGRIDLRAFWARRFRRLMPALFVTLVGVAVFGALVAGPGQLARLRADGLATLGYVANWRFIVSGEAYGDLFGSPSPLLHAWSLAIEEQFYVVFPLLVAGLLVATRGSRRALGGVLGALAAGSAVLMVVLHQPGDDPSRVYYGTDTRMFEILAGALLALWVTGRGPARSRAGGVLTAAAGAVALAAVAVTWVVAAEADGWLYEGGLAAYTLATVAVVAAAVHPGPVRWLLSVRPLRWLGRVSYGVYLFHWPLFLWLTPARTGLSQWPLFGVRVAVTLALAALSYRLVEHPVRVGARLTGWRPLAAVPASAAAVALALVAVTLDPPSPGALFASPAAEAAPAAHRAPAPPGTPTLMVAGDSVAVTIGSGIEAIEDRLGVRLVNRGALGCGLAIGDGRVRLADGREIDETPECRARMDKWAEDIAVVRPDAVLLVQAAWDVLDREIAGRWSHACRPGFDSAWEAALRRALGVLASTGAPVAVATIPDVRSDIVITDTAEGDRRVDCLNRIIRRVAGPRVVDLAGWVCPERGRCRTEVAGKVLRPDGVHFDGSGGPLVARWIVPRTLAATGVGPAAPQAAAL